MSEPNSSRLANADLGLHLRSISADTATSPHWRGLGDARDEAAFGSAWLALQCSRIAGAVAGLLLIPQVDAATRHLTVTWPPRDLGAGDLLRLAETAYAERRMVVAPGRAGPDTSPAQPVALIVAVPLGTAKGPFAAAAIALSTTAGNPTTAPAVIADQLRWGAGWLEALPWARHAKDLSSDVAQAAVVPRPSRRGRGTAAAARAGDRDHERARNPPAVRPRVVGYRSAKRCSSPARGLAFRQFQAREPPGRCDRECDG